MCVYVMHVNVQQYRIKVSLGSTAAFFSCLWYFLFHKVPTVTSHIWRFQILVFFVVEVIYQSPVTSKHPPHPPTLESGTDDIVYIQQYCICKGMCVFIVANNNIFSCRYTTHIYSHSCFICPSLDFRTKYSCTEHITSIYRSVNSNKCRIGSSVRIQMHFLFVFIQWNILRRKRKTLGKHTRACVCTCECMSIKYVNIRNCHFACYTHDIQYWRGTWHLHSIAVL